MSYSELTKNAIENLRKQELHTEGTLKSIAARGVPVGMDYLNQFAAALNSRLDNVVIAIAHNEGMRIRVMKPYTGELLAQKYGVKVQDGQPDPASELDLGQEDNTGGYQLDEDKTTDDLVDALQAALETLLSHPDPKPETQAAMYEAANHNGFSHASNEEQLEEQLDAAEEALRCVGQIANQAIAALLAQHNPYAVQLGERLLQQLTEVHGTYYGTYK